MEFFDKIFGNKGHSTEINLDNIGLDLTEKAKESIRKFISRTDKERMGDIIILGEQGDPNFFYLMYYATLYDSNKNVRFSALKRIPNFTESPNFDLLIEKLAKPNVGENLEPYFSMMLFRLSKITETELKNRINGRSE